jgi:hypothetical protein
MTHQRTKDILGQAAALPVENGGFQVQKHIVQDKAAELDNGYLTKVWDWRIITLPAVHIHASTDGGI